MVEAHPNDGSGPLIAVVPNCWTGRLAASAAASVFGATFPAKTSTSLWDEKKLHRLPTSLNALR